MECIFHNLLGLLECVVLWIISMLVINVLLLNFLNRALGIINFEKALTFPNFNADTMNLFQTSMSV